MRKRTLEIALVSSLFLLAGLLRFWSLSGALPFPTNVDELASDFFPAARVPVTGLHREVMFYPGAYAYLSYLLFGLMHGFGSGVTWALNHSPSSLLLEARFISATAGTLAVPIIWLAVRWALDRTAALFSAALAATTFLPVSYSHMSVDDSLCLFAASTVLLATIGAYKTGRLPWLIAAGAAAGFAAGSKYTGGYLILCPILILIVNRRTLGKKAFLWLGLTLAAAAVVFAITTPYALMHPQVFLHELRTLNEINGRHWVGEAEQSATTYYLWTLTWAFGWLPLATSLVGAVLLIRRERNLAIVLLIPGVALWFLCALKATYFARFLLPGYPMLMLLSGLGCAFLARAAASKLPFVRVPLVAGVICVAVIAPGLWHSVHFDIVWSRASTYSLAADWIKKNVPSSKVIAVDRYVAPWWPQKAGSPRYSLAPKFSLKGRRRDSNTAWGNIPGLSVRSSSLKWLDNFEASRNCLVMTSSFQAGRIKNQPMRFPKSSAYYRALSTRRGELLFQASPLRSNGAATPPDGSTRLNFDWSYDSFPMSHYRPGPVLSIYWLKSCGKSPYPRQSAAERATA